MRSRIIGVAVLTFVLLQVVGCASGTPLGNVLNPASTDSQRLDGIDQTITEATPFVLFGYAAGIFSDKQYHDISTAALAVSAGVDKLRTWVNGGGKLSDQQAILDSVNAALQVVVDAKVKGKAANGGTTTRPSTRTSGYPTRGGDAGPWGNPDTARAVAVGRLAAAERTAYLI